MIHVAGLRKVYRVGDEKVAALSRIDPDLAAGEVCCIVGGSGSGKSKLMNMLAGREKATKGEGSSYGKRSAGMEENQVGEVRQEPVGCVFPRY